MCKRDDHTSSMDVTKGREVLPANVKPTHYDITLEPDLEAFTYTGKVIIELASLSKLVHVSLLTYFTVLML